MEEGPLSVIAQNLTKHYIMHQRRQRQRRISRRQDAPEQRGAIPMSPTGIQRQSGVRRLALAAGAVLAMVTALDAASAQSTRQQREVRDNNRQIQQQLDTQQRDQQLQFQMNQLRDQQMRQQQFQPLPPPTIGPPRR